MINKLAVQVLDAPLDFAFILRVRWMSKMRFNSMNTAPTLPLIPKL
ncbi:MAG: hypothetical protein ABSC20_08335 [Candidatus Bathyarchaeia archaeon]